MLTSFLFITVKEVYIFYKTTNTVTGKFYYGVHTVREGFEQDGYLGSGTILKKAIQKYGRKAFVRETVSTFDTIDEAYEYEKQHVTLKEVLNPDCYNVQVGGVGNTKGTRFMQKGEKGIRVLPEHVEKLQAQGWVLGGKSRADIHTEEWRRKVSEKLKGHPVSQETIRKILKTKAERGTTTKGRKLTEEHKQKIREGLRKANLGKTIPLDVRQKCREAHQGRKGIVKDGKRKNIHPWEIERYLLEGWSLIKP